MTELLRTREVGEGGKGGEGESVVVWCVYVGRDERGDGGGRGECGGVVCVCGEG